MPNYSPKAEEAYLVWDHQADVPMCMLCLVYHTGDWQQAPRESLQIRHCSLSERWHSQVFDRLMCWCNQTKKHVRKQAFKGGTIT